MRAGRTKIEEINALAELDRIGYKWEPAGSDEVRLRCPAHDDKTPSAALNTEKNVWRCHACKASGDVVSLLCIIAGVQRATMLQDLSSRYDLEQAPEIDPDRVEAMHSKIWNAGPLLQALRDRGITDEMIREARLGFHDGRITIPVRDASGRCVNIRRYLPGAPGDRKMLNSKGRSKPRLYQVEQVDSCERVWVCGGEMKALVVGSMLKLHGVGACAVTAGEGNWSSELTSSFKGKQVWVCFDVDQTGRTSAAKIAGLLYGTAEQVRIIKLPLGEREFPKGDVNDFVGKLGATAEDLLRLMADAPPWDPPSLHSPVVELGTKEVTLPLAAKPENVGWRLQLKATLAAQDTTPYLVPATVDAACDRQQPYCHICPIKMQEADERGNVRMTLSPSSDAILSMVASGKDAQASAIKDGLGVPACKSVEFSTVSTYDVMDARLTPQLEISGHTAQNSMQQPALIVGATPDLNTPYSLEARVYPHPKNQHAWLVVDKARESEDSLSTFAPSKEELDELRVFQPSTWALAALEEAIDRTYGDIEQNVTRIFGRRDMHLTMDIAWHSPLHLPWDGKRINGWTNVLVVGDSAQGKSETFLRLMEHYGLGERVECKNATVAGLLGGLQQMGNRWFVSWGVIPAHDRRLVGLEEVKGASIEVLSKLTDMRSSGIAEIPKIERRRANARTRLVFISNARSARPVSSYSFGVEALHELMGSLEDLRRFDFAIIVASGQVRIDEVIGRSAVEHKLTKELCRRLVLWAWTRKMEQVSFEAAAIAAVQSSARALCSKYSEAMPLIDRGTVQHKLARISAAIAARTFSSSGEDLIVREPHVQFTERLIDRTYSNSAFGYDDFSAAQKSMNILGSEGDIMRLVANTKHPRDLASGLLYRDDITLMDLQDWCEVDRDAAQGLLSFLVRNHALRRNRKMTYAKTPDFIGLLKKMQVIDLNKVRNQEEL